VHRIEDGIVALLLGAMIVLAGTQIVLRNVLAGGAGWIDPLLRVLVLWVGLLGAVAASRSDKHIAIDGAVRALPPRAHCLARGFTCAFTASVAGLIAVHSARFVAMDHAARVVAFAGVPAWVLELVLPVGFALIALRYLLRAAFHMHTLLRRPTAASCDP
jgi:TRAP-type C4-dicarboxylate transport system permease small subunit